MATTAEVAADLAPGAGRTGGGGRIYLDPDPKDKFLDPIKPGTLSIAEPASASRQLRGRELTDNALRITQNGRIAWQTQPGIAFPSGGPGTVDFEEHLPRVFLGRRAAVGDHAESDCRTPWNRPGRWSGSGARSAGRARVWTTR